MYKKTRSLAGKTLFITGTARGIGKAIALCAAEDGANIVGIGKTDQPHQKLSGTIHETSAEIEALGGKALAVKCDVRYPDQIQAAIEAGVAKFGGIDIVVNNASAIDLRPTGEIDCKAYALMQAINRDGTFHVSKLALPYLRRSGKNPQILTLSPPLRYMAQWLGMFPAYASSKFGMSIITAALAAELRDRIAVNSLWPRTLIATAAVENFAGGEDKIRHSRKVEMMAHAAHAVLTREGTWTTPTKGMRASGNFYVDEQVLGEEGVSEFGDYSVTPGLEPYPDIFLDVFPKF